MRDLDSKSIDLDYDEDPLRVPEDLAKSGQQDLTIRSTSHTSETDASSDRRDEVQEIRNRSRTEDRRVQLWRVVLLNLIVVIGAAVSGLTFHFLQQEEHKALNVAVCI